MILQIAAGIIVSVFGLIAIFAILAVLGQLIEAWSNYRAGQRYLQNQRHKDYVEAWASRVPPDDRPHQTLAEWTKANR